MMRIFSSVVFNSRTVTHSRFYSILDFTAIDKFLSHKKPVPPNGRPSLTSFSICCRMADVPQPSNFSCTWRSLLTPACFLYGGFIQCSWNPFIELGNLSHNPFTYVSFLAKPLIFCELIVSRDAITTMVPPPKRHLDRLAADVDCTMACIVHTLARSRDRPPFLRRRV